MTIHPLRERPRYHYKRVDELYVDFRGYLIAYSVHVDGLGIIGHVGVSRAHEWKVIASDMPDHPEIFTSREAAARELEHHYFHDLRLFRDEKAAALEAAKGGAS